MIIEAPRDGKTPAWTEEDELEFQIGDMDGIAFTESESKPVEKKEEEVKKVN